MRIENGAPDPYQIAASRFTVIDDEGGEAPENLLSVPWRSLGNGTLVSSEARRGWVGFLVDKEHAVSELRWEPVIGSADVYRWDLSSA